MRYLVYLLSIILGSPPISRTLSRRPKMAKRSVHVEAKEVQHSVQARNGIFKKSGNVLCQGIVLRYQAIRRCRNDFPIRNDVPVPQGVAQWLLRLGRSSGQPQDAG